MSRDYQRQISADSGIEVNRDASTPSGLRSFQGINSMNMPDYSHNFNDEEMKKQITSPPPNLQVEEKGTVHRPSADVVRDRMKDDFENYVSKPSRKPLDYVLFAAITSLAIPCLGLPALIFALKSRKEIKKGNVLKGWQHSKTAIVLTSIGLIIIAVLLGTMMIIIIASDLQMEAKQKETNSLPIEMSSKDSHDHSAPHKSNQDIPTTNIRSKMMTSPSSKSSQLMSTISNIQIKTTTSKGKTRPNNLSFILNNNNVYKPNQ